MRIKPKEFQTMPGSSAMFYCISNLPVEWTACSMSEKSFKTKSLPRNTLISVLGENQNVLAINNITEDNYGSYCCKYEHPNNGEYFVDWADLVKGTFDEKKTYEFLQTLPHNNNAS